MVTFAATIKKFNQQGEKTGWTFIEIPAAIASQLKPGNKKSFRVKGKLDSYAIHGVALMPMGEGLFIMALKNEVRKAIGKQKGAEVLVKLEVDSKPSELNKVLKECLDDEPAAKARFFEMPLSHQNYYSKWIEAGKTEPTREKRIVMTINSMLQKIDFGTMLRNAASDRKTLGK